MNHHAHFCLLTLTYDYILIQILRFIRPRVIRQNGSIVLAIRLVEAFQYLELEQSKAQKILQILKEIGETNVSLDFLKDGCTDHVLKPTKNRKKKNVVW